MSAITSLRNALEGVTDEAEDRVIGVLRATESAVLTFVNVITDAVELSTRQVVEIFFGLAQTFVAESFSIVDSVVTVVLGAATDEGEDFSIVVDSVIENDEEGGN